MRGAILSFTVLAWVSPLWADGQQPVQTFRSGRELLTIETSVRDADGKPLTDLQPSDFSVRIDGQPRQVLTVQLFGGRETAVTNQREPIPRFTRAAERQPGRAVVFAIDRDSMRPGSERAVLETISRLIEKLSPPDAAGLVEFPGRAIELTRDHKRVADALKTMTGTSPRNDWQYYMSWDEAVAYERKDKSTIAQVVARECHNREDRCPEELRIQAGAMLQQGRVHADAVLSGMASVLRALSPLRAPKKVVMVSAGLPYDQELLGRFNELVENAARAHVAVSVLHVDQPGFDAAASRIEASVAGGREYATGLANIASATGGEFFMSVGAAQGALDRIAAGVNVFYQLGVESKPSDADGKTHRVEVRVGRTGAKVQAPAQTAIAPRRTDASLIREALAQPTDVADVPLEVATYVAHSVDRAKVRVIIAAQLAPGVDVVPADWGYVFVQDGKELHGEQIRVAPGQRAPWTASASADLDAGPYRVRTAVATADGRVAVVEVPVVASLRAAEALSTGDLMIGTVEEGKLQPRSAVRQDERAAAMIEVSSSEPLADTTGTLLITRGGTTQPAIRVPLVLRTRADDKSVVIAESPIDLSPVPPGVYTASAVLAQGGKPVAQVNRVFEVTAGAIAPPAPVAAVSKPATTRDPLLEETMARVGRYVTDYAEQASLIVGVEHYDQQLLDGSQNQIRRRKTVAEFALVRTSDVIGWSGFRDVTEVDGKKIANHADRLQALFRSGSGNLAEARRIADESARYNIGPTRRNFNEPTAALFFFAPPGQSRFVFTKRRETTIDGVPVWEIDFKEIATPTLIRTTTHKDVPAQGTLWAIAADGAVVRTRLVVSGFAGFGSKSDVEVSYARDARLGMWLPSTMRERDDSTKQTSDVFSFRSAADTARQQMSVVGTATYSDFKRFETSATVKIKK